MVRIRPLLFGAALGLAGVAPAWADALPPAVEAAASAGPTARRLDQLDGWVRRQKGELSALVVELGTQRVIAAKNPGLALNPASNAKVLTAAAVLMELGPAHRFRTGLYGKLSDGTVDRLVLRSTGDPSLRARDLERMAKDVADLGLKRVKAILVDQAAFDAKFTPPAFEQQPNEWAAFRAPVSAVSLDQNAFVVRVEPTSLGEPAKVSVDPAGYVEVEGKIVTGKKGSGRKLHVDMRPSGQALTIRVSGSIALGTKGSFAKRIDNPELYAGYVLRAQLKRRGVSVDGGVSAGGSGETSILVEKQSEPLSVLVRELGKNSDNFYAETLLKALGSAATHGAGSSADGAKAVRDWLQSAGALESDTRITNGSGLFDANRVSAGVLVRALDAAQRDSKIGAAFLDQLAVGGVDGTLRNRYRARGLRGNIRAKTGTLARAHALAGFVLGSGGKPRIAFAVLINGIAGKADEQRRGIDRVVAQAASEK
ncbi:MAG: D-alanyl-D-alanine carboxypeptidase/D-alanyl-D-alanine-endopeptidase [Myxococcales bacterium]|nr:D-alanyl-D-alanine carboxypeptidase/D-alanyl-D-alanine-endopeptidase [Myxococcales bacterium]